MEPNKEYIKIAEILHNGLCNTNHTDGCSWFYESWENPGWTRMRYYLVVKYWVEVRKINFNSMNLNDLSTIFKTFESAIVTFNRVTKEYELNMLS